MKAKRQHRIYLNLGNDLSHIKFTGVLECSFCYKHYHFITARSIHMKSYCTVDVCVILWSKVFFLFVLIHEPENCDTMIAQNVLWALSVLFCSGDTTLCPVAYVAFLLLVLYHLFTYFIYLLFLLFCFYTSVVSIGGQCKCGFTSMLSGFWGSVVLPG